MNKINIKRFLAYYKPYKGLFFADLFFAILGAVIAVILPLFIRYISNNVVYWEKAAALKGIAVIVAIMLFLLLIEMYCNYFIAYYGHIMGARMEFLMRNELFAHYQKLSFSFFDNQHTGHLMSRVTSDLFDISELLHHAPEEIIVSGIKLIGTFTVLLTINQSLALVSFLPVPAMVVFAVFYNKKMKSAFVQNRSSIADINATMEDNLAGMRVVKSFANESVELEKFKKSNAKFIESKRKSYHCMGVYNTVLGALTTIITILVAGAGTAAFTTGLINLADLLIFIMYIGNFTEPIRKLVLLTEQLQNGTAGFERFCEMMDIEPEIADAKDAQELHNVKGDIIFRHVSFNYDAGECIFDDLNLHVAAGDFIALVGPSGVGKTTLCALIPRFYEVSGGCIAVDGKDIRSYTIKSLRENIGIVQQDQYMFSDSIIENIRYGKPNATDEEVIEAAKLADAHDFISALPDGYNTYVGQRGFKLSGGQKQRLSIARVFLKNPPILIFDEATSALDNETERNVQDALERLAKGRTTFVIAHRLSTIRRAKRILVLTQNGISEEGTHEELLNSNGEYAALYKASDAAK